MDRRSALVGVVCLVVSSSSVPPAGASARTFRPAPTSKTTIAFEPNVGQMDARARYVARLGSARAFVAEGAIVLASADSNRAIRLDFVSAAAHGEIVGESPLQATRNYFLGDDASTWRTGVRTFSRVRYAGVFPGIDAILYGTDGVLEHDFVVAPGADPASIVVGIEGVGGLRIASDGALVGDDADGRLRLERPSIYQVIAGTRHAVAGAFVLRDRASIGFTVGAYDRDQPLVIDPVISYSTFLAGTADESGAGVTVDSSGHAFVTGGTSSLDFPVTGGSYSSTISGLTDGFVTKLATDGSSTVFTTYFGGSGDDGIARAAVDASGNVFVCGGTSSANLPTTVGAFRTTFGGGTYDGFVAKLDATGSHLLYSTYIGGTGDDGVSGVAIDASGDAFVTGGSTSTNYPTTPGAFDTNNSSVLGLPDAVVTKLNATGSALVYSTYLGAGFNLDAGSAIAVDAAGAAIVVGGTSGGFPTTTGALDTSFNGGSFDAFVTKLNASGTALTYSTYLGGSGEDYAFGVALDATGDAYVTGYLSSTNFPVVGPFQSSNAGGFDAYVSKLNPSGSALVYSSYLGGSGNEGLTSNLGTDLQIAGGIAVDSTGAAYVTGFTSSTDFPVVAAWQPRNAGGFDAWVAKIAPSGASKTYASYLGGAAEERGLGIAVDSSGAAFVTGFTYSANFPTTSGVTQPASPANGLTDGFVTKIGAGPGDTVGIYVPQNGTWFLRTSNTSGNATSTFSYGPGGLGWIPLAGDWDGNGTVTAGLYDPASGAFFLKDTNGPGAADAVFTFGLGGLGYVPLVGDWDGDGMDTVGLYDPSTGAFFLRNANASGAADIVFGFGLGGDNRPISGDWDGDGIDTVGLYVPSTSVFFLRNANAPGPADLTFTFGVGNAGFVAIAGDWNADESDSIGLYQPASGTFFLKNSNAPGAADAAFVYGPAAATPVVGHWGG